MSLFLMVGVMDDGDGLDDGELTSGLSQHEHYSGSKFTQSIAALKAQKSLRPVSIPFQLSVDDQ